MGKVQSGGGGEPEGDSCVNKGQSLCSGRAQWQWGGLRAEKYFRR